MNNTNRLVDLQKRIIEWYKKYGRDFPWRHTKDPYKIMIAELMLHRTKAEQVVTVYNKFIEKFPDIHSITQAQPEEVLSVTEHLGLHWRGRHFIESSRYIVKNLNGKFPDDYNELMKIPGIGEYIAGAIVTVCFGKPAPVVDSNIARFINRYWDLNLKGEIRRNKKIIDIAKSLFSCKNPGKFLFYLIDFTSIICRPGKPHCNICILKSKCKFYKVHKQKSQNPV